MNNYWALHRLILRFNSIYSNALLGLKLSFLICLCIIFYIPIGHPHIVDRMTITIMISTGGTIMIKITQILVAMGSVRREEVEWKKAWTRALSQNGRNFDSTTSWLETFNSYPTLAFSGGTFYNIQPSGTLSFISIATTYVIVVLQV